MPVPIERSLVLVYGRFAASPLDLAERFAGLGRLVWIFLEPPEDEGRARALSRLMAHFGEVHLAAGRSPLELAEAVAPSHPAGVMPLDDTALAFTAELAGALGLPGHSRATVERLTDKAAQRAALEEAGLASPRFVVLEPGIGVEGAAAAAARIAFPAVVKPRNGAGSRHTYALDAPRDLVALFAGDGPLAGSTTGYVLEERIEGWDGLGPDLGDYVSIESVVLDGRIHHLATSGRFPLAWPFRETGGFLPAAVEPDLALAIEDEAATAVAALGVAWGATHTEIKLTPTGPAIIEVNGRTGGGPIDDLFLRRFGVAASRFAAAATASGKVPPLPTPVTRSYPYAVFVQPPPNAGRLAGLAGLDRVAALPGFFDVLVNRSLGEDLDWRSGSMGYVAAVFGEARDLDELRSVPRLVEATLAPRYDLAVPGSTLPLAPA